MTQGVVLVTGAAGLLGHWLLSRAPVGRSVVALTHRRAADGGVSVRAIQADLRDPTATLAAFEAAAPDVVIHAAYAKDRPSIVDATANLAEAAQVTGAAVLFVSTDAVFPGDGRPRAETAVPAPIWDYGRWKAEAEGLVLGRVEHSAVVRLSLLTSTGPDDHTIGQIRHGVASGSRTRWFTDEYRQPTDTGEVAEALWRLVDLGGAERAGLWHLPGPERLSRFELAQRIVARLDLPSTAIEPGLQPVDSNRPADIVMDDARARAVIDWAPSPVLVSAPAGQ